MTTPFHSAVDRMVEHLNASLPGMYVFVEEDDTLVEDKSVVFSLYSSNDDHSDFGILVLLLPMEWSADRLQLTIPVTKELYDVVVGGQ